MNEQVQAELKKIFNGRFSTSESTRANYARGEDTYDPVLSQAVVFPETNEEVSKILKLCNDHKIPVVPFGTGTSLEVVDATLKLSEIQLHKIKALFEYNVAYGELMVLTGKTATFLNQN